MSHGAAGAGITFLPVCLFCVRVLACSALFCAWSGVDLPGVLPPQVRPTPGAQPAQNPISRSHARG